MAAKKKAKGGGGKGGKGSKSKEPAAPIAAHASPLVADGAVVVRDPPLPGAEYFEDLPVTAELHERDHAGHELAKLVTANETLKTEKREALADFKERKASIEATQKELASVYDGMKLSKVKVQEFIYPDTCTVDVVRKDTGEVIRSRAATQDDLQRTLDDATKAAAAAKAEGLEKEGDSAVARLDEAIKRGVAQLPALKDKKASTDGGEPKPEDLAPEPGSLKGPDEVDAPAKEDGSLDADEDDEEDDGDEPDEDDPLGLGPDGDEDRP